MPQAGIWTDGSRELGRLQGGLSAPGLCRHESIQPTGPEAELLNPANALKRLLLRDQDPAGANFSLIPVFRDPKSGVEITKPQFRRWLNTKLKAAGPDEFVHSLRIGGATSLFELEGEAAVLALGGWASAVFRLYSHLSREQKRAYVRHMGAVLSSGTVPKGSMPIGFAR